jgi:hypothetical protein
MEGDGMNLFALHLYFFEPDKWPVVAFRNEKTREDLLYDLQPSNRILHVGSCNAKHRQGRKKLLGFAEIADNPIGSTLDVVDPSCIEKGFFNDKGCFRWPYGLRMSRAWRFTPNESLPDAKSHIGDLYSKTPRRYYRVNDHKVDAIMNLTKTVVKELYQPT